MAVVRLDPVCAFDHPIWQFYTCSEIESGFDPHLLLPLELILVKLLCVSPECALCGQELITCFQSFCFHFQHTSCDRLQRLLEPGTED